MGQRVAQQPRLGWPNERRSRPPKDERLEHADRRSSARVKPRNVHAKSDLSAQFCGSRDGPAWPRILPALGPSFGWKLHRAVVGLEQRHWRPLRSRSRHVEGGGRHRRGDDASTPIPLRKSPVGAVSREAVMMVSHQFSVDEKKHDDGQPDGDRGRPSKVRFGHESAAFDPIEPSCRA